MSKTRILEAVKKLDLATTRELLDSNPGLLKVVDRGGRNLLHLACSADCKRLKLPESAAVRMADLLLDRGIDIESYVFDGNAHCTPLFFAVARGRNTALIKYLLKRGASVRNAPGGCLFAAGWYDDVKHLDILLRAGAEIDNVSLVSRHSSPAGAGGSSKLRSSSRLTALMSITRTRKAGLRCTSASRRNTSLRSYGGSSSMGHRLTSRTKAALAPASAPHASAIRSG